MAEDFYNLLKMSIKILNETYIQKFGCLQSNYIKNIYQWGNKMFDNIGEKLKILSVVCIICAVFCFIAFLGSLNSSEIAILYLVYTFSSIIGSMLIYGFGELIQTTQGIHSMLSKSNLIGRLEEDSDVIAEESKQNTFPEKMNSDDKLENIKLTTQSIKRCKSCDAICNINTKTCDMCGYKF